MEKCLNKNSFNDALNGALNLLCVTNQRELIVNFMKWFEGDAYSENIENLIDEYIEINK